MGLLVECLQENILAISSKYRAQRNGDRTALSNAIELRVKKSDQTSYHLTHEQQLDSQRSSTVSSALGTCRFINLENKA